MTGFAAWDNSGYDDFANGNGVVSLLLGKELVDGSEGVGAQNQHVIVFVQENKGSGERWLWVDFEVEMAELEGSCSVGWGFGRSLGER